MRVDINEISLFVIVANRVQEEELVKLATFINAKQLDICAVDSRRIGDLYPKKFNICLYEPICGEVIEFLQRLPKLPS